MRFRCHHEDTEKNKDFQRKAASYNLPSVMQWFLVYAALTANIS